MIQHQRYGTTAAGQAVDIYTLGGDEAADFPLRVEILTLGGIISAIQAPDRQGRTANVALGLGSLAEYEVNEPHFGCITGRYANRIAGGRFTLDGVEYRLDTNAAPNSLHGGFQGLNKRVWQVTEAEARPDGPRLALRTLSPAGEGYTPAMASPPRDEATGVQYGFPGNLEIEVTYQLSGRRLRIDYLASSDAPTVLNLTNHTYWNLAGEGAGAIDDHELTINADHITAVDAQAIPTGQILSVAGTPFDFRAVKRVGQDIRADHEQIRLGRGYDHNWILNHDPDGAAGLLRAASLYEPNSGRRLDVWTTEPGIQCYSGNFLDGSHYGPSGRAYRQGDGLALETQHFPDSPNRPEFPSTVLRPGRPYRSTTIFELSVES